MRALSLVPGSSLKPSSTLRVHWQGVGVFNVPREDYYPDDAQLPSDAWHLLADAILSSEAFGTTGSVGDGVPRLDGGGIPSAEAFGTQDASARVLRYPSSRTFPGTGLDGSRVFTKPYLLAALGVGSAEAFDVAWLEETIHDETYPGGPVGPPRVGLRPAVAQWPGHIPDTPVEVPQILYLRIHFPGSTVFPSRGLYLDRYDNSSVFRRGHTVAIGRETIRVRRNATFRTFKAVFDEPIGHLDAHGVFSSDVSDRMAYVVDLSDGKETSELSGGVEAVDLLAGSATVELALADETIDLADSDFIEAEIQ